MIKNPKAYARFAGICYLGIFVLALFANFAVMGAIGAADGASAARDAIVENELLFRIGIAVFFAVLILDILVAWSLFFILLPVSLPISALSMIFHLAYTVSHIGALLDLSKILQFLNAPEIFSAVPEVNAGVWHFFFFNGHQDGFTLTLVFFGAHLIVLGYLIFRATFLPRLIGVIVAIAGFAYVADGFANIIWIDYQAHATAALIAVALPALVGEGALMLWLTVRGLNDEKWHLMARPRSQS